MRIWTRLIARREHGFLKPGDSFIPFLLFNQVSPDIVVRIAKLWIKLDRLQAFSDGALVVAKERICPTAEGVGLSGREHLNGTAVEFDGLVVLALHLKFVGFLKVVSRGLAGIIVGHKRNQG